MMRSTKPPSESPPRVELLVGTWKQYGRGIIEGVWRYAQKHGPWLIEVEPTEEWSRGEWSRGPAVRSRGPVPRSDHAFCP